MMLWRHASFITTLKKLWGTEGMLYKAALAGRAQIRCGSGREPSLHGYGVNNRVCLLWHRTCFLIELLSHRDRISIVSAQTRETGSMDGRSRFSYLGCSRSMYIPSNERARGILEMISLAPIYTMYRNIQSH